MKGLTSLADDNSAFFGGDDGAQAADGGFELVVDYYVMVVRGGAHFFAGDCEAPLHVILGVGAAAAKAPLQLFPGWRCDKDEDRIWDRFLHGDSASHLDLQHYV